jgi:hypothetical protein
VEVWKLFLVVGEVVGAEIISEDRSASSFPKFVGGAAKVSNNFLSYLTNPPDHVARSDKFNLQMSANEMSAIEMADIENEMSESATTTAPRSLAACLGYDAEAAGDKDSTKLLTKAQRAGGSSSDESDNSENNLLSGDKEQRKGNRKAEFIGTHFLIFLIAGWALDFARPLVTHGSYSHFGLDTHAYPRLGDFMHFLYDLIMIALLYSLMSHSSMPPSTAVQHFTVAIMTHGMAFHLVGDAVQSRLVDMGVDTSLHVHETPLIEACSSAVTTRQLALPRG